jgi:hypothetical protein
MKTMESEALISAPSLLNAFRKGQEEFEMDAASEECLELLDHLVERLRSHGKITCQGLEDACIFLLEHLAARLQQQEEERKANVKLRLIQ